MACFGGNNCRKSMKMEKGGKLIRGFKEKVRFLQEEVKGIMVEREREVRAYEREMVLFTIKETEWKQERKKLKEEVRRLRKVVEEQEAEKCKVIIEARKSNELVVAGGKKSEKFGGNWELVDAGRRGFRVENVPGESAWRDEAVEKWKKLYLAIKTELDDLIQITHRGDYGLYLRAEEEENMEELKMEVKAKEETIEELKARLAVVEQEEHRRAREMDILRQSLRIMTSKTPPASSLPLCKPKLALLKYNRHLAKIICITN